MSIVLFSCEGGDVVLPDRGAVLVGRADGGHVIINPPRQVWERSELTLLELTRWSALVAATGRAMIDVLPQLDGGCVNYWEAGNWSLNDDAEPKGPKTARNYRSVHLHLLGRSRTAKHSSWQWGEAPVFPRYSERLEWAAQFERLTRQECLDIVARVHDLLIDAYSFDGLVHRSTACVRCGWPY